MHKEFYHRKLPHWQPKNAVFDVNFRLEGSLPKAKWIELKEKRDKKIIELKKSITDENEIKLALQKEHDLYYGKFDTLLDKGDFGPTWLKQPEIIEVVSEAFHYRHAQGIFKLVCFSIMSNHVHAIFYKVQESLDHTMQSFKRHTGKQANLILGRTGQPFWQPEGYDHKIRNRKSLQRRISHNLNNPVTAGLCNHWSLWSGNYLNPEFQDWMPKST